jgi:hypothetical protein
VSTVFTPGPWTAQGNGREVRAGDGQMKVCDIRGWGYLTGKGCALALPDDQAIEIQKANERLIAAAPDYATACGLDLHPGEAQSCGPLAWLRSAIDTLADEAVREAAQGDDPDAYFTMLTECRFLAEKLEAANAKARGETA